MARRACARIPHHITAFFIPRVEGTPLKAGSMGAGLVVDPPAKVCVTMDGKEASVFGETARLAAEYVGGSDLKYEVFEPLPQARGYATSAAIALGVAFSAAVFKGIPVSRALEAAHRAEVEARTGLGDVVAIAKGGYGVAVRLQAGGPGEAVVDYIPPPKSLLILACDFGSMTTEELLSAYTERVRREAERSMKRLVEEMTFETFVEEAQRFSVESGLAKSLMGEKGVEMVKKIPGLVGFYVKKKLLITIVEEDRVYDASQYLKDAGLNPKLLEISGGGPRVGWV